ncbi:MAG: hypothetical protein QXL01_05030 [Thermoplasmatales archaeon]
MPWLVTALDLLMLLSLVSLKNHSLESGHWIVVHRQGFEDIGTKIETFQLRRQNFEILLTRHGRRGS